MVHAWPSPAQYNSAGSSRSGLDYMSKTGHDSKKARLEYWSQKEAAAWKERKPEAAAAAAATTSVRPSVRPSMDRGLIWSSGDNTYYSSTPINHTCFQLFVWYYSWYNNDGWLNFSACSLNSCLIFYVRTRAHVTRSGEKKKVWADVLTCLAESALFQTYISTGSQSAEKEDDSNTLRTIKFKRKIRGHGK